MNPLRVPELFFSVLDYLDVRGHDAPSLEERRALVALAQTCRAFSEPSLSRLWRRLRSLLPLVRTFADVVDEARVKTPPTSDEWRVIHRYSPRIQQLTLWTEHLSLDFLRCTNLVLPNLKVFTWKSYLPDSIMGQRIMSPFYSTTFLWPLLTRGITALDLPFASTHDPKFLSFLERFPDLCQDLKSIKLAFMFKNTQVSGTALQALSRGICSHVNWQCVDLPCPIDGVVLKHLGTVPTLKTAFLYLSLDPETIGPVEAIYGHTDTPFCNVRELTLALRNRRIDFVTGLLRARGQAFRSFRIHLENTPLGATDISAFFTAVASPLRIHSLRSLTVWQLHYDIPELNAGSQGHLLYEAFSPITALVHLRELVIELGLPIPINDEEFASLVCSWPCLEVLSMVGRHDESLKRITLKGLQSLLVSCKHVRDIRLSLDARRIPPDVSADVDACSLSVTRLHLQDAPIDDAVLVEEFLSKHVPCVLYVTTLFAETSDASSRYLELWTQVNTTIRMSRRTAIV